MAITLQGTIRADKYDHAILEALDGIRASVRSGNVPNHGICYMLASIPLPGRVVTVRTRAAYGTWAPYTGNPTFPVPAVREPDECREFLNTIDRWGGEYGALRISLLDHLIQHFEDICYA